MKQYIKSLLLIFFGITIGIILYFQLSETNNSQKNIVDSLFVSEAHAQNENLSTANEAISNSRRNIITEAVEKISPAIVSVNVLAVRESSKSNFGFD